MSCPKRKTNGKPPGQEERCARKAAELVVGYFTLYGQRVYHNLLKAAVLWIHGAMCRLRKRYKTVLVVLFIIAVFIIISEYRPPCLWSYLFFKQFPKLTSADNTDLTIVTAYLNLGLWAKAGSTFSLYKYLRWSGVFQHVQNPLVVYTDSEQVENMLLETRKHLANKTRIIRVHRTELWAFRDLERIRKLFESPHYPKHQPNTIIPEYPCSQHAKYEFVQDSLRKDYVGSTKYIAWVDIGYFRYLTQRNRKFWLVVPPGMDDSKVAVTQVIRPDLSSTPEEVFKGNYVWVGGGMSVATRPVFTEFVKEYRKATDEFLNQDLSNTDQQVVYSMLTDVNRWSQGVKTQLQTYSWVFSDVWSCWFYLGYYCYREEE